MNMTRLVRARSSSHSIDKVDIRRDRSNGKWWRVRDFQRHHISILEQCDVCARRKDWFPRDRRKDILDGDALIGPGGKLNARCVELRVRVFEGSNEELAEFNELLAALARMEAGTWGQCAKCGQAIGRDRLRALPETRCCMDCVRSQSVRAPSAFRGATDTLR